MNDPAYYGELAFVYYWRSREIIHGEHAPDWETLPEVERGHWIEAAAGVRDATESAAYASKLGLANVRRLLPRPVWRSSEDIPYT